MGKSCGILCFSSLISLPYVVNRARAGGVPGLEGLCRAFGRCSGAKEVVKVWLQQRGKHFTGMGIHRAGTWQPACASACRPDP